MRVELLPTKSRIRSDAGFTLVELLTVALLVVIILGAIFPKVHSAYSAETVREARYVALAYVTTARAVSLQKGLTAVFHSANQQVWVTADSNGAQVSYRPVVKLDSVYSVAMTASGYSIVFKGRGIAVGVGRKSVVDGKGVGI